MTPLILVINCGSSSLKFSLYDPDSHEEKSTGLAESLGSESSVVKFDQGGTRHAEKEPGMDHAAALGKVLERLNSDWDLQKRLIGIGHRVVHGGEAFKASTIICQEVIDQIENCVPLAPLHNPANLMGIKLLQASMPDVPQVAVFDTAFHQTMPEHAYIYGIPYALYRERSVRRYGFHGTSHRFIAQEAAALTDIPVNELSIVSAHLGNGASVCAIKQGQSVDTSMGMTPLEGLLMGTRSGDVDPGLFDYLISAGQSPEQVSAMLNKQSGLLGISEFSNDMRALVEAAAEGNQQASLAIEVFCFRLAKYIAAMSVSLDKLDALVFTGGIGENAALVRSKAVQHLRLLGYELDTALNDHASRGEACAIHRAGSHPIWIIPTDEEGMIALDTYHLVRQQDSK